MLTFYDDATGERTELSGATLGNWVAKTANLLVDGCGLGPGDQATVWLPPHWQTAAVLLGAWSAGLTVAYGQPTAAGADVEFASLQAATTLAAPPPSTSPQAVSLPAVETGGPADRFVLGLAPMGLPLREVPAGWADYVADVRQHGDHFPGAAVTEDTVALIDPDGTRLSHAAVVERAAVRAAELGITGGRVLIDADVYPWPVDWLLAPLVAGARIVLSINTDLATLPARAEAEQATGIVGPTI
jgi:uncharacterized protein (TIGR03089 family)